MQGLRDPKSTKEPHGEIECIDDGMRYLLVNDIIAKHHNLHRNNYIGKTNYEVLPIEQADEYVKENQIIILENGELHVKSFTTQEDKSIYTGELTEVICTNTPHCSCHRQCF